MKSHITYEKLLELISLGIIRKTMIKNHIDNCDGLYPIKGAIYDGLYLGSPGEDIFLMLSFLDDKKMKEVAICFVKEFPTTLPLNHVNVAACIRCIYGQTDKQGVLTSEKSFEEMKEDKPDWNLSRKFLKIVYDLFKKNKNIYGLMILDEIEGHRLGDEALMYNNKDKLNKMEQSYLNCIKLAYECNSYKQMFSPYFWASNYFIKYGDKKKAIDYCKLAIKNANEYCDKYIKKDKKWPERFLSCLEYLKNNFSLGEWTEFYKKYKKDLKSETLKISFEII